MVEHALCLTLSSPLKHDTHPFLGPIVRLDYLVVRSVFCMEIIIILATERKPFICTPVIQIGPHHLRLQWKSSTALLNAVHCLCFRPCPRQKAT